MTSQHPYRTRRCEIRWTADDYALLATRARQAGISVSDYVRYAALGIKYIPKQVDDVVNEMRRIGALIKHNYPSVKSWSDQDRKRYWETREILLAYAEQISEKAGLKIQTRSKKDQKKRGQS